MRNYALLISIGLVYSSSITSSISEKKGVAQSESMKIKSIKWAVYYTDDADVSEFDPYELLVLDSESHPAMEYFRENKKLTLGYLSLGETSDTRWYFDELKRENALLMENKNWPGSFFNKINNKKFVSLVIERLIPDILHKGFNGIFIDTIDNPIYLESLKEEQYSEYKNGAINLIHAIRYHYPDIKIMMNRGFEIVLDVAHKIDYLLAESLVTTINFENNSYQEVPETEQQSTLKILKALKAKSPEIEIFSLNYWDVKDSEKIKSIYMSQRKLGFHPYVARHQLMSLVKEPK